MFSDVERESGYSFRRGHHLFRVREVYHICHGQQHTDLPAALHLHQQALRGMYFSKRRSRVTVLSQTTFPEQVQMLTALNEISFIKFFIRVIELWLRQRNKVDALGRFRGLSL